MGQNRKIYAEMHIGKVLLMVAHSGMVKMANLLKARLSQVDYSYMLKCHWKNGMNGYNFSKTKQLLYWAILLVNPKRDMTLNIGNNAIPVLQS